MDSKRECGVLLHPTSLPGRFGQGELGKEAYQFIDFLKRGRQKLWQVLPLNPVGYGESPYQPYSAFAGNPILISTDKLIEEGLLAKDDLEDLPSFSEQQIQFAQVREFKYKILKKAYQRFLSKPKSLDYLRFIEKNGIWLDNYTLFRSLLGHFKGTAWNLWPIQIAFREPSALNYYRKLLAEEIQFQNFLEFEFESQWLDLKKYANEKGIKIIGDLPIFVAHNSSDVWSNPHLFYLDEKGTPLKVAGVPPDYFSDTGQLWGNPLYRWEEMKRDDYQWWRERFKKLLELTDLVRVDHFRGFDAYWEIPAGEKTAVNGRWAEGPGEDFFTAMEKYLGKLPVIAEDLGVITPRVDALKDKFNYPGMKVLQFILEGMVFPLDFPDNTVVYTGTHDNDTILGWYKKQVLANSELKCWLERHFALNENCSAEEICWYFVELAYSTKADRVIIPLQDFLCLDSEARMNLPGTTEGNWGWRVLGQQLTEKVAEKMSSLVETYKR